MLDPTPRGVGAPITDRAAAVVNAERLLPGLSNGPLVEDQSHAEKPGVGTEERRYGLVVLTMAECLENKGRFLPAIEKDIRALCSEKTWVGPMHDLKLQNFNGSVIEIDLISAMTVWNLATADWLLGDRLSPETRRSIRAEADRRVFVPFLAEARGQAKQEWWSTSLFNWNAVVHSGIVGAATALIGPVERRAEIIAYAEQNGRAYLTGFKADGYTGEGLGYWNYGFGHYTLMAETLLAATRGGINLYAGDRTRLVEPFAVADEVIHEELKNSPYKERRLGIDLKAPVASATVTLRIRPVEPAEPEPAVDAKVLEALRPDFGSAVTVNAADLFKQEGGNAVPTAVMSSAGGAMRNWKTAGHALTWKVRVPATGAYGVQVRHCADAEEDTACELQVDGKTPSAGSDFLFPPTGGWSLEGNDWKVSWLARGGKPAAILLPAGEHEVTLVNRGGGSTLDWVRLVPLHPQG